MHGKAEERQKGKETHVVEEISEEMELPGKSLERDVTESVQTVKRRIRHLVKYMQETGQKLTEF